MKTAYTKFFENRGERLRQALSMASGLDLQGNYRGSLKCGPHAASVVFDSGESIRVSLPLGESLPPLGCLEANRTLSGNVRFAKACRQLVLLAETRVDGVAHLPASFEEISESLARAARRRPNPAVATGTIEARTVKEAVAGLAGGAEAVVELPDSWEIRPRIAGTAVPVRMTLEGGQLRLQRTLLNSLPTGDACLAVAEQALRFNGELRLARIVAHESGLLVESCLHSGQVDSSWIALAARAVATAFDHSCMRLQILSEDQRVARCYAQFFC